MLQIEYFTNHQRLLNEIVANVGTPCFITDAEILRQNVKKMKNAFGYKCKIYYAIKTNYNPAIISTLRDAGVDGVETVSIYEILLAKKIGFIGKQILFTGNNVTHDDLDQAYMLGVIVNIGSISELKYFASKYKGEEISIRINPGFGDGAFSGWVTGGEKSKFGILHNQLEEAKYIIKNNNMRLIGVHCHLGSGLYTLDKFEPMVKFMFEIADQIDEIRFVDCGGGIGVAYNLTDIAPNLDQFAKVVNDAYMSCVNFRNKDVYVIFEPGKYLVAESTFLLCTVTNIRRQYGYNIVGVNTGMNHIIRPSLYDAYHHVLNISNVSDVKEEVRLVGNICESTDVINKNVLLSAVREGDVLAILNAGAYCSSMSNLYNLQPYAAEVLIDGNQFSITRRRLDFEATVESLGFVFQ